MEKGIDNIDVAITICDKDWTITYMNKKSQDTFGKYGGASLIGANLLDCHSPSSREKLVNMRDANATNTYTIEKSGKKKLIHQAPYCVDGSPSGFVELSIELPSDMDHFIRS